MPMLAIVSIAGQQFKVAEGQEIYVHRLDAKSGDQVSVGEVLMTINDGATKIGTPYIPGSSVKFTVVDHVKGDKVIVFKKKRRKGYKKKIGHRQLYTKIKIDSITV